MHLHKSGYYADFVVYPLLITGLLASRLAPAGEWHPFVFVGLCMLGVASWTLFEYLLHRYALHRVPILLDMHEAQHADPLALIGTPSWASSFLFIVGALLPLWWALGWPTASAVTAGLMLGYLGYVAIHHITHHWRLAPSSGLYRVKHRHARHHFAKTPGNFGVTTMFWDVVFGTDLDRAAADDQARNRAERASTGYGRGRGQDSRPEKPNLMYTIALGHKVALGYTIALGLTLLIVIGTILLFTNLGAGTMTARRLMILCIGCFGCVTIVCALYGRGRKRSQPSTRGRFPV
ncbi:Fatty acid hydroxylase superfamily protein [Rhizobiales bacterium GAS113]|nr:Fatty acid hydroxylase superfamily protein [Rhizobiales bacterium GAS113]